MRWNHAKIWVLILLPIALSACYQISGHRMGGEIGPTSPVRHVNPGDVALTEGYRIEAVALGLTCPTGIAFDESGEIYVTEAGYSKGEMSAAPRLVNVSGDGDLTTVASGAENGPWTGVIFHRGSFYVAEGGEVGGGRILRIERNGSITPLISDLPSRGDHHTNGPVAGPDGFIYFTVGTYTNSGIVGADNYKSGWLGKFPDQHDIPCQDVVLAGENYSTENFLAPGAGGEVQTGAFSPFGEKTRKGQVIDGRMPCSGSVLRIWPGGGKAELVAWGFRNPFGMAFSPAGRLFVTENQFEMRGSRPVFGAGDLLWEVEPGRWYGWPDFHGPNRLDFGERYTPPGKSTPRILLAEHPARVPPRPAAVLGVHASIAGFDFSRNPDFGHFGQAFVAAFGNTPDAGKVLSPVGYKIYRVNVETGVIHDFAVNKGMANGPASWLGTGGLERPVAARFDPSGTSLYVVDFGVVNYGKLGAVPRHGTGVVWRVTRKPAVKP